jgi:hypothetical protein
MLAPPDRERRRAETQGALDQLVASGLVFQRGTPPAAAYQYKQFLRKCYRGATEKISSLRRDQ